MFMERKIELLLANCSDHGFRRNEFIIYCGSSFGFRVTHTALEQNYLVINTGLMLRVHYSNKIDMYGGDPSNDISVFSQSFIYWLQTISVMKHEIIKWKPTSIL